MILLSENANGIRVWASSNEWLGEGGLICVFPLLLVIDEINKVTAAFFVCLHRFFSLFQFKLFVSQHFFYSFIPYPWNLYRIDKSCFFCHNSNSPYGRSSHMFELSTIQIWWICVSTECDAATDKTKRISSISHFILFRTKLSGKWICLKRTWFDCQSWAFLPIRFRYGTTLSIRQKVISLCRLFVLLVWLVCVCATIS